jgi:hypothetical protein
MADEALNSYSGGLKPGTGGEIVQDSGQFKGRVQDSGQLKKKVQGWGSSREEFKFGASSRKVLEVQGKGQERSSIR